MRPLSICVFAVSITLSAGCTSGADESRPPFAEKLIGQLERNQRRNPPAKVWRYNYGGRPVFYVPPYCCDAFGDLYDEDGELLCHPDGGQGSGEGKCPDFLKARSRERLLWADSG